MVRICCGSCRRRLGDYPFSADLVVTDEGERLAVRPQPRHAARPGRKRPERGAALYTQEMSPGGRYIKATWYCGCGATPQRRDDRWGRLEVSEGQLPTVYIS
jgi:hypothetical protein